MRTLLSAIVLALVLGGVVDAQPCESFDHSLLSAMHSDTVPGTVTRGALITGQGEVPRWSLLGPGTTGQVLTMGLTEPEWASPACGDVASPLTLVAGGAGERPLGITAAAGQTANLIEVTSAASANLFLVGPLGIAAAPSFTAGVIGGPAPGFSFSTATARVGAMGATSSGIFWYASNNRVWNGETYTVAPGISASNKGLAMFLKNDTWVLHPFESGTVSPPAGCRIDPQSGVNQISWAGDLADSAVQDTLVIDTNGLLVVAEKDGGTALLRVDGETIVIVSAAAGFSVTKDAASSVNVYYENGTLRLQNLSGITKTLRVGVFGVRWEEP